ncbi:MAG: mechanosensitive ion channel family protein [Pseudanabaenales cyanobacterium]|nr:mechanosensitive ion channel family protein [Pseudanabaenales cyanobacterium]
MSPKKLRQLQFFLRLVIIASLLILGQSHCWIPMAHAQLPSLLNLDKSSKPQPSVDYVQIGNAHIADITLDGEILFSIAAPASNYDQNDHRNILPIEWRTNEIQDRLDKIMINGFDPETLKVTVRTINNETVIVVAGRDWEQRLMTVTELDRHMDDTFHTLSEIAEERAEITKTVLLKANRERQPEYFRKQLYSLGIVLSGVIISSLIILQLKKLLKQHWRRLNQTSTEDTSSGPADANTFETAETISSQWISFPHSQELRWIPLSVMQQRRINLTLRFFLGWGQITIWLGGSIWALLLFPQTRAIGWWLIEVPVSFITILLGFSVAKKTIDILVVYWLDKWADYDALRLSTDQRIALRIPTITRVCQEVTLYALICGGILLFLETINAPLTLVLTLLGIVSFSAQNLIKDWIGGFLILWEDQYTQGDFVKINTIMGCVEYLNLRITQLRTFDGELVTIGNGSITTAINLTHQWSRLNLGVDVAYSTDLDKAMMVIEEVAVKMRRDSVWGKLILEPPNILGVDAFGDNSITIRLLIKTQPMKHWEVGREYRRRLKQAFDLANITIPFPQRSIWLENVSRDA